MLGLLTSQRIVGALLVLGLTAPAAPRAYAADASAWDGDERSAMRLVSGSPAQDGARVGVEIRLSPGWKTYWRYPGDSGVPPRFHFDGSDNVRDVTVLWPAPQRFDDGAGGTSIGYKTSVILPLRVVPNDPMKPVTLRLALDYAICEKLCVPAEGKATLKAARGKTAFDAALTAAEARVPKAVALGAGGPLSVHALRREPQKADRVLVDIAAPADSKAVVFVEGPTPDWALPIPERIEGAPAGVQRFAFALDGLPSGATADGAELKVTVVSADAAIETTAPLK